MFGECDHGELKAFEFIDTSETKVKMVHQGQVICVYVYGLGKLGTLASYDPTTGAFTDNEGTNRSVPLEACEALTAWLVASGASTGSYEQDSITARKAMFDERGNILDGTEYVPVEFSAGRSGKYDFDTEGMCAEAVMQKIIELEDAARMKRITDKGREGHTFIDGDQMICVLEREPGGDGTIWVTVDGSVHDKDANPLQCQSGVIREV